MNYVEIQGLESDDAIQILKDTYQIRFTPKYAEHIWDNYKDNAHKIKHTEIRSIIKKRAILVSTNKKDEFHCLSKFKNKIYLTVVIIKNDEFLVKTSYICSLISHILTYNDYEYQSGY